MKIINNMLKIKDVKYHCLSSWGKFNVTSCFMQYFNVTLTKQVFLFYRNYSFMGISSAGRIKWVRSLHSHLEDLVMEVSSHPVLTTLSATSELLRRYSVVSAALVNYEADMKGTWMKQNVSFNFV